MLVYSLESPHRGDSNEYIQHTIIVYKIEKISLNRRYLLPELVPWLTLSGSNYPCLERISMVPKMFEPLSFDCIMHQRRLGYFFSSRNMKWVPIYPVFGIYTRWVTVYPSAASDQVMNYMPAIHQF